MSIENNLKLKKFFRRLKLDLSNFYDVRVMTVNSRDASGDTPLHMAAIWGDADAIETLLEAGADIDAIGDMSCTPLHYAVSQNKVEAAKLLIERGASLDIKNELGGSTPAERALLFGSEEIKNLFVHKSAPLAD